MQGGRIHSELLRYRHINGVTFFTNSYDTQPRDPFAIFYAALQNNIQPTQHTFWQYSTINEVTVHLNKMTRKIKDLERITEQIKDIRDQVLNNHSNPIFVNLELAVLDDTLDRMLADISALYA